MIDLNLSARRFVLSGITVLVIFLGGFGAWSATARIASAVIVDGTVRMNLYQQVVQHRDGGIVASIHVRDGDFVAVGDTLMKLDAARLVSKREVLTEQLNEALIRAARLKSELKESEYIDYPQSLIDALDETPSAVRIMASQTRLFTARRQMTDAQLAQLDNRVDQIDEQQSGLSAQRQLVNEQLELLRKDIDQQEALLESGLSQLSQVLNLRRQEAAFKRSVAEISSRLAEAALQVTELELQKLTLQRQHSEKTLSELREQEIRKVELVESLRIIELDIARTVVQAPISGRVHDIKFHVANSVVQPGETIMQIVPQDQEFTIAGQINPHEIDQVIIGQPVVVSIPALEYKDLDVLTGSIGSISADTYQDQTSGHTFYKVEFNLDEAVNAGQSYFPFLSSGMPATVFVQTGEQRAIAYLIRPFTTFFSRAMRER